MCQKFFSLTLQIKSRMNDIWNEICFELSTCIQNNVLEKEYENAVCNCMVLLGWKKYRGEIVTQYPVQAGHENKYADIVILQDNVEQFVIEIKRPNHILQEEDEKQLFSYMRLLKHQVIFGLYIGDKIRLYYDDIASQQLPEQVFSIDIEENNSDGLKFVELFSKDSFNVQTVTDFCKEQKMIFQKQIQIQNEIAHILSDTSGQIFKDALRGKYISEGYSEEWVESVLNQIALTVSSSAKERQRTEVLLPVSTEKQSLSETKNDRDYTKYSISGGEPLAKNRFVLAVVRKFVNEHPNTYSEYAKIFNALKSDAQGVIKEFDSLLRNQIRNYFTGESECLISQDGIKFVVCNQWKIQTIQPIIRFANLQGYNVIEYKS
jgi:hypothetical protein